MVDACSKMKVTDAQNESSQSLYSGKVSNLWQFFGKIGMAERSHWWTASCLTSPLFLSFSRMRSKGSRFTLGVWGLRVCSLDVAFASATVRNRSQPSARGPYGRAYGKFCRGGNFWRFQTCRCFVSRGRRGTSWHSDVFWNVSKVVLRGRHNTFATFSEDVLQVFVAGAALWTCPSPFFVAGAAL